MDSAPQTIFDDDKTRHYYDQIAWFSTSDGTPIAHLHPPRLILGLLPARHLDGSSFWLRRCEIYRRFPTLVLSVRYLLRAAAGEQAPADPAEDEKSKDHLQ